MTERCLLDRILEPGSLSVCFQPVVALDAVPSPHYQLGISLVQGHLFGAAAPGADVRKAFEPLPPPRSCAAPDGAQSGT